MYARKGWPNCDVGDRDPMAANCCHVSVVTDWVCDANGPEVPPVAHVADWDHDGDVDLADLAFILPGLHCESCEYCACPN